MQSTQVAALWNVLILNPPRLFLGNGGWLPRLLVQLGLSCGRVPSDAEVDIRSVLSCPEPVHVRSVREVRVGSHVRSEDGCALDHPGVVLSGSHLLEHPVPEGNCDAHDPAVVLFVQICDELLTARHGLGRVPEENDGPDGGTDPPDIILLVELG